MALIKCNECGKEISDKANSCPNCGCPITIKENNSNKIESEKPKKKKNVFLSIIRYIIGIFCLLFMMSTRGIGILFVLVSVALILPITSNYIYLKINVPKILKIVIPIVLIIISISIGSIYGTSYDNKDNNNTKGNIDETNIEKWLNIYASGTIYGNTTFKPTISISPIGNYKCNNVSFTMETYITYEGEKISSDRSIFVSLNEHCRYYTKDEMTFNLSKNPHASARVKYTIKSVKGNIEQSTE